MEKLVEKKTFKMKITIDPNIENVKKKNLVFHLLYCNLITYLCYLSIISLNIIKANKLGFFFFFFSFFKSKPWVEDMS